MISSDSCYFLTQEFLAQNYPKPYPRPFEIFQSSHAIFSDEECELIYNLANSSPLKDQYLGDDPPSKHKDETVNGSKINYVMEHITTKPLYDKMRDIVKEINNTTWRYNLIDFGEPFKFAHYSEGKGTAFHIDTAYKSVSLFRKLTIIIQLSEEEEYEGGDLIVQNIMEGGKLNKMTRKKGHVIIFPSFLLHKVEEVKKGNRNSVVIFAYGPCFC